MTTDSQIHRDHPSCGKTQSNCQRSENENGAPQLELPVENSSAKSVANDVPYFDIFIDLSTGNTGRLFNTVADQQIRSIIATLRPLWTEIDFEIFTDSITNKIFSVSNRPNSDDRLIFRVFGRGTSEIIDRDRELENMNLLAAHGIAAVLFAKFRNGIVCGYLNGRCLDLQSIRRPHIVEKICANIARLHRIPCAETESFLFPKLNHYIKIIPQKYEDVRKQHKYDEYFTKNNIDLKEDIKTLHKTIEQVSRRSEINSRIVFSHNDLLVYNILYDEKLDKINFIDYEYAAANYQLFDLANHFCEYAGINKPNYSLCPNYDEKSNFIRCYLRYYDETEPLDEQVETIVGDIRFFEMAAHLFWCVWNMVQSHLSDLDFDYIQYGIARHKEFAKILLNH